MAVLSTEMKQTELNQIQNEATPTAVIALSDNTHEPKLETHINNFTPRSK